jgi:hypothetical protein
MGCNCGKDKGKGKDQTIMKGTTTSFAIRLIGGQVVPVKDVTELEARALMIRMGGGTLERRS